MLESCMTVMTDLVDALNGNHVLSLNPIWYNDNSNIIFSGNRGGFKRAHGI